MSERSYAANTSTPSFSEDGLTITTKPWILARSRSLVEWFRIQKVITSLNGTTWGGSEPDAECHLTSTRKTTLDVLTSWRKQLKRDKDIDLVERAIDFVKTKSGEFSESDGAEAVTAYAAKHGDAYVVADDGRRLWHVSIPTKDMPTQDDDLEPQVASVAFSPTVPASAAFNAAKDLARETDIPFVVAPALKEPCPRIDSELVEIKPYDADAEVEGRNRKDPRMLKIVFCNGHLSVTADPWNISVSEELHALVKHLRLPDAYTTNSPPPSTLHTLSREDTLQILDMWVEAVDELDALFPSFDGVRQVLLPAREAVHDFNLLRP